MNRQQHGLWWTAPAAGLTAVLMVVTGVPAGAVVTPEPTPTVEPSASPEPSPGPSTGPSTGASRDDVFEVPATGDVQPDAATDEVPVGGAVGPDGAPLVMDGVVEPASDGAPSVGSTPVPEPSGAESEAAVGAFGAADVIIPTASDEQLTVVASHTLDDLVNAAASATIGQGDSIVVGAAVAPVSDLAEAVYGAEHGGFAASSRPDLVVKSLPRAAEGDSVTVEVTPQLVDGTIPGAAFAAAVSLDEKFGASWIDVAFDASGFANAYGGDYGDRLELMVLPECALTTPEVRGCLVGVPLETRHAVDGVLRAYVPADALDILAVQGRMGATRLVDLGTGELTSGMPTTAGVRTAVVGGGTIIAAVSGADSQAGSFKATDLAPRGTWGVTEPAGGFTYSIPVATPPVSAGASPSVSLNYSSQATDGKTSASNSQAGVVGEGWSAPLNYIERLYKPCTEDGGTTPQLCWDSPYSNAPGEAAYVMSLQGSVQELAYESSTATTATYRAVSDPTLKVTRFFGTAGRAGNGDNDGEYFRVETNDGGVYYFGYNPGGTSEPVNSIAWEPVWANNTGEPGFAGSNVVTDNQAYRFMLDLSVDSIGNATTYSYATDTNKYTASGVTKTYVRDIQLSRIEYGQQFDSSAGTVDAPEAKVEFDLVNRCVEGAQFRDDLSAGVDVSGACAEQPSAANAASYPDVPVDLMCTGTSCNPNQSTPTYFSTVRLNQINTFARDAAGDWVPVETTQLITAFPTTADGSARSLWLDSVYTRGWGDPAISDDDADTFLTKFSGVRLNNRVDWDMTVAANAVPQRPMDRMRISSVFTDLGGRIDVTYAQKNKPETLTGTLSTTLCPQAGKDGADYAAWLAANPLTKTNSSTNSQLCFAVKSGATTSVYHNYVVTKVALVDLVGGQPTETHSYAYGGAPFYARATSLLYAVGSTYDTSTFSSYRGFEVISSHMGDGASSRTTTNQYFRGTDVMMWSFKEHQHFDSNRLQGRLLSSEVTTGSGSDWARVSLTEHYYDMTQLPNPPQFERADVTFERFPHVVDLTWSVTEEPVGDMVNVTEVGRDYDPVTFVPTRVSTMSWLESYAMMTQVQGSLEMQCSATDYASSASPYMVVPVDSRTYDGGCGGQAMTGRVQIGYDGGTPGSTSQSLASGLVTEERSYSTATEFATAKAEYDARGRIVKAWMPNEVGNTSPTVTWAYGQDAAQPELWTTTVTRALGATSTIWSERGHGNTVKVQGATAKDWTHYQYDSLGLMTAGWAAAQWGQPGTPSLAADTPTVMYRYDIYADGPTLRSTPAVVTTAPFVGDTGTSFPAHALTGSTRRSMTFLDGFGRSIEQHAVAPDGSGGRTVTATRYNDLGQVAWSSSAFAAAGSMTVLDPSGATMLVNPALADLATATGYTYDARGRSAATTSLTYGAPLTVDGQPVMTTYAYSGLTSTVTAPNGATTTTTTDVLGRPLTKVIGADSAHSGEASQTTTYEYSTLTAVETLGFQQVTVTDTEGEATVFESNLAGQRTRMVDPNAGTTTYAYDANGQTTQVTSPAGTITMGYDVLGRMVSRTTGGSSSATWDYVEPGEADAATDLGLLRSSSSTTHTSLGDLTTVTSTTYDDLHRPVSSTVTLPSSPAGSPDLLGELSGVSYETTAGYDAIGQPVVTGLPAMGGLGAETVTTGYRLAGSAETLTLSSGGLSTPLVTGVGYSGTGQLVSRAYGNGVSRDYVWDVATRALTGLSASFVTDESGSSQTAFVQKDSFTRDVMGRITTSVNEVPVADGTAADGQVTAECFAYDGFNRLSGAWTVAGTGGASCGAEAPADAVASGWDASTTAYAAEWSYSTGGRITELVKGVGDDAVTNTYAYEDAAHPAAVTQVVSDEPEMIAELPIIVEGVSDDFESNSYSGGTGTRWSGDWVETQDDDSATDDMGLVFVGNGMLHLAGSGVDFGAPGVSRTVDVTGAVSGALNLGVLSGDNTLNSGDILTVRVTADGDPARVVTQDLSGGSDYPKVEDELAPPAAVTETVDVSGLLPASSLEVSLFIDEGDGENNTTSTGEMFLIQDVSVDLAGAESASARASTATGPDGFVYDAAGRMVSRDVDGVATSLTWDMTSSLVESDGQGGHVVYAYDAGGQRVLQARVADADGPGSATGYVASGQVHDANTATAGGVTATRYYTFAGSTVAVRTDNGDLSLMLGDEQGSTNVMMPVTVQETDGKLASATLADVEAVTRTAYTPYGELRGGDNLAVDRGWLGQVEDRVSADGVSGTGLTYLNARYYDPALGRFLSPDPLMNPGDPRTLDPYRYAENNPVVFTDASGLRSTCASSASKEMSCAGSAANKGVDYVTGSTKVVHTRAPIVPPVQPRQPKQWPTFTPAQAGPDIGEASSYFDTYASDYFSQDQLSAMDTMAPDAQSMYARMWAALSATQIEYLKKYPDKSGLINAAVNTAAMNYIDAEISDAGATNVWIVHYSMWREGYGEAVDQAPLQGLRWASEAYVETAKLTWYGRGTGQALVRQAWTASDIRAGMNLGNILFDGYDLGEVDDFEFDFDPKNGMG
ncbi:hypothetical protein LGT39_12025 [Demequina sp. TTPB684]|uniref:RHS repeat-associated core domain-containing protein n=1 Tax=unclassified Demequina TaxID=2620311 RepID=UPI001CF3D88B|nr:MULTISPECIES: RHS repeat-associated core domain-containing protein [unclassified Demequina]MCB2413570.1 hypothetical protein [Demequina sp. TTPB684]